VLTKDKVTQCLKPTDFTGCAFLCSSNSGGLPGVDEEPVSDSGLLFRLRRGVIARACCAALPLQLLALMLLGFAALVPLCEQDCVPPNNFLYSLHPLYRYTDGQPPVWPEKHIILSSLLHLKSNGAEHSNIVSLGCNWSWCSCCDVIWPWASIPSNNLGRGPTIVLTYSVFINWAPYF